MFFTPSLGNFKMERTYRPLPPPFLILGKKPGKMTPRKRRPRKKAATESQFITTNEYKHSSRRKITIFLYIVASTLFSHVSCVQCLFVLFCFIYFLCVRPKVRTCVCVCVWGGGGAVRVRECVCACVCVFWIGCQI